MLKYMLDTNICIYVIKRRPLNALETFNRHARSEGLTLVTNNLREFERIEALRLENWV